MNKNECSGDETCGEEREDEYLKEYEKIQAMGKVYRDNKEIDDHYSLDPIPGRSKAPANLRSKATELEKDESTEGTSFMPEKKGLRQHL